MKSSAFRAVGLLAAGLAFGAFAEGPEVRFEITSSGMSVHGFGTLGASAAGPYDVYLAVAPEGESLPAAEKVWEGWENDLDTRFNVMLGGLEPETTYAYAAFARGRDGEAVGTTNGTFRTGRVYWVDGTAGDDENDGLSAATAVKTPERAFELAAAAKTEGNEVRVASGRYAVSATLQPAARDALVGLGAAAGDVVLDADFAVDRRIVKSSARHVSLANLSFVHARTETFNGYANWGYPGAAVRVGLVGGNQNLGDLCTWVSNCTFVANTNLNTGAGALFLHGGSKVVDCRFEDNYAGSAENNGLSAGGAAVVQCGGGQTLFARCTFARNVSAGSGGALSSACYNGNSDMGTNGLGVALLDCAFTGNAAADAGGALDGKVVLAKGCTFEGNAAKSGGVWGRGYMGAFKFPWAPLYRDCAFRGNSAAYRGGGFSGYLYNPAHPLAFSNCTFAANSSAGGCSLFYYVDLDLRDCTFAGNVNESLADVKTQYGDWGFTCGLGLAAALTARGCVFSNNVARGTSLLSFYGGNGNRLDMDGCAFAANELRPTEIETGEDGRAVLLIPEGGDGSVLRNTLFANNTNFCGWACALSVQSANATNDNLTIVGNRCFTSNPNKWVAAGVYQSPKNASVFRNCLVLDNVNATEGLLQNFYQWGTGTFMNCLEDGEQLPADGKVALSGITREGTNGRAGAMKFRDAAHGDWTPRRHSAAWETGRLLEWMTADATDVRGLARVYGAAPDVGAFENQDPDPSALIIIR